MRPTTHTCCVALHKPLSARINRGRPSVVLRVASLFALVACGDSTGLVPTATYYYQSSPGEFVGAGNSERVVYRAGQWQAMPNPTGVVEHVWITLGGPPGSETWDLHFAAPSGQPLAVGTYESALRYGLNGTHPGLSVTGHARGCNTLTGRFVVRELALRGNELERLHATFEQHCEGAPEVLSGMIYIGVIPG
jgi:hypothetical protein